MSQSNSGSRRSRARGRQGSSQQHQLPPLTILTRVSTSPQSGSRTSRRAENGSAGSTTKHGASSSSGNSSNGEVLRNSLLVTLSESCRKHSVGTHGSGRGLCCLDLDAEADKRCRDAIHTLRQALPKVEDSVSTVQDVEHMCDFYNDAVSGGFCPHAPHLFLDIVDVLPRVHFLFRHLTSEPFILNTMQQHGLLATHICHTVARLLNAVPNSSQLVIMIDDLIYLSKDLSALYESGLLERNADTTHVFAEVVLFEETTGLGDWSSRAQPKFTLRILNGDALLCLQSAVLLVLERFVAIRKERRLQQQQSDAEVVGLEELDRSYLIIGDPDLYFSNSLNAGYEGLRALLATLRQALLASVDPSAHGGLVLSLKQAAARVLLQLQADWHRTGAHSLAIVQEVAVLSARSAVDFLRTKSIVSASHTSLDSDLAYLVQSLILVPPSIQGSLTSSAVDNAIYGATFSVICDSFRYMKSSTGIVNDIQDETVTENDQALRRPLETVLLRTIHVMLHSLRSSGRRHDHGLDQLPSSLAFQMIWTHDAVRHLFRLLNDRALSDNAVWILSHLLCRIRLLEIEETAKLCVHMCHSQSQATEGDNTLRIISEIDGSSSTLRSKKRLSTHCALNGEIVTQPAFSGYMAVLNKRRKKDSGWTKRNTLSCLDDELLLCLILGLRSASSLRARLQGEESLGFNGITDGKHADSIFQEVVNVSSAIRLLLASAKNRCDSWNFFCHTLCPSLSQVVKDFLDTISIVSAAISAACKPNVEENPLIRVFGEAIVPCGMLVELFVSTTNSLQVPFLSKALSCIQSTRDVAQRLRMLPEFSRPSSNLCSAMPKALYETLHGLSIHRRACVNTRQPTLVCLFEEMLFSVTMGTVNGSSLSVVCAGPILLPVDIAVESQIKRLELLAVCRGEKDDPVANEATVEQKSFDAIKRADKAHPDPFVRLLLWQSLAWIVVAISPQDLRQTLVCQNKMGNCTEPHLTAGSKLVLFLIDVAFADPDPVVRDYSSRELGKILSVRNWTGVLALMSSNEEWQQLKSSEMCRGSTALAEQVTSRLFRHVDSMLHKLCSVPQSQLSFTVASAPKQANSPRRGTSTNTILSFRRAAARSLCSLCGNAPSHTNSGRILVEHAIIRVVRMWSGITASQRPEDAAVCFAELSRLSHCSTIGSLLREKYFATFAPALFRDMLVPSLSMVVGDAFEDFQMMPLGLKERQCDLLSNFLRAIFLNSWTRNSIPESLPSGDLLHECEACLPNVISQLVVEKDYDALKSITGYKLYLLAQKRLEYKQRTRNGTSYLERKPAIGLVVGESFNTPSSRQWCRNLEEQTRELCLAPGLIEQIIPQVFMRAGRDELLFFTRNVLQDKLTLKQLVTSRELPTLKNFVIELGRNPEMTCSVARAMKAAAIARNQDTGSASGTAASGDRVNGDDSLVTSWVTPHFMYLLVNVIQSKWTTKSIDLRIEVFRSLVAALDFLRPSEASQYLPQIMATVNSAVADEVETTHESLDSSSLRLKLLAVQVLKKFVKLVATTHWEVLGQNLTFVVVSLDPIFSKAEGVEDSKIEKDCRREAVALFECLTQGDLGIKLAPYFSEIPFLPPSSALDSVRASLRSLGVNFDNLQVATTQGTQDGKTRSTISDAGSSSGDSLGADSSAARQAALRRRLETVCPLLENENSRVRCVVLQHLTALLRANRELFHALVENEGMTSTKSYVTVAYRGKSGFHRWTITEMLDVLLSRCIHETEQEARILLATCLGEVGAIGAHRLEEVKTCNSGPVGCRRRSWDPPWHSAPHRYELQIISSHLVAALKSAPTSSDQHKIAFTIQQILDLLNEAGKEGLLTSPLGMAEGSSRKKVPPRLPDSRAVPVNSRRSSGTTSKPQMEDSLVSKLVDADVLEVVEPFWISEFHEAENTTPKQPPFFCGSPTFYDWLSNWCRYMVHRAHDTKKNEWTKLFFACRTALRTQDGLGVAEFLLPILILDRLCFGNGNDQNTLLTEIRDVLTFENTRTSNQPSMSQTDRRKAVSVIFSVLDLLQFWVEPEVEQRYIKKGRAVGADHVNILSAATSSDGGDWQQFESAMRIEDMIGKIPLPLRAKAAASVGMHASALRFLEMASRSAVADAVFGKDSTIYKCRNRNRSRAAGSCPEADVSLMKDVLASLNDYETMSALADDDVWASPQTRARDSIRQKEALRDWQGALHDYERAQQLNLHDPSLRFGVLRCLLELGHFESVLQQVNSTSRQRSTSHISNVSSATDTTPLAVEASWRLGRWEALSDLVEFGKAGTSGPDALYQVALGEAMLHVERKDFPGVCSSLRYARCAVMDGLSSVARESYTRAYDHVVRLQALREIEDVSDLLCSQKSTELGELALDAGFCWDRRLDLVSSSGATTIINSRLALARLAGDAAFEGSLFLHIGKRGRKSGLLSAAANSFAQAEAALSCIELDKKAIFTSSLQLQFAKLKHDCGESSMALRMLGQEDIETMADLDNDNLVATSFRRVVENLGIDQHGMDEKKIMEVFVRSALQSTRWMIEGGLKGGAEIIARFRIIHRVAPCFEKGHFQFAKYIDSLLQSRIKALKGRSLDHFAGTDDDSQRSHTMSRDKTCQRYVVLAVTHYAEALVLDVKHVYQALPRLLSLWFDFTAIKNGFTSTKQRETISASRLAEDDQLTSFSLKCKEEINSFMARSFKRISAQALYTAMPQLISRIIHDDTDTASVVQAILRRVLTKYPAQAMWPLAWVRQSRDPQRQRIGVDIFHHAVEALSMSKGTSENLRKLLATSKILIDYLYALAKKEINDKTKDTVKVKPLSDEVDLSEFVPPIQAALSASLVSGDSGRCRDVFPRHIPRMRAFDECVGVMISKARPKRLKAYVVSADSISRLRTGSDRGTKVHDVGEIHFLVKQEAKGDLRKDARVQDLNNVINRIMSSNDNVKGLSAQRRRLHLRTFSVTCLSEETGLLEWVPHTAAIRSFIAKTYNPQANVLDGKRQGKRITNFNDPQMRIKFEKKCQESYFVSGNLTKAAALFESECLKSYPPVLYWWFVQQFPDPHAWYEARTRFTLSTAIWSAVGHVIGLGDRHTENILLDRTTGECVHVDFDCIFDKGLYLPKPEVIPFRLTQNLVDAFGPTGADGVYSCNLKAAMGTLRDNRDTLLSVLEPFVKDPVINWKKYRSQQKSGSSRSADPDPSVEAKQKMSVIDERLRGIYNLRNPNYTSIRRTDRLESQEIYDLNHPIPLSVEGQVHKMIAEATSNENLVQLYVGWMPWV